MELIENTIIHGNSAEILKELPRNSIDLVVTSPPYSNLRNYNSTLNENTWNFEIFKSIADLLYKVIKPGGVIVWIVNDKTEKGSKTLVSFKQALYFQEIGFNVNDVMIWCLSGGTKVYAKINDKPYSISIKDMVRLSNSDIRLWDGYKWVKVKGWKENTSNDKYLTRITLRSGERIFCTKEHTWVLDNNEEITTENLKVGDTLKTCILPNEHKLPKILTKDVLWLIGLYIAEGSHSGKTIQLSLNADEKKWMSRIKKTIENLCGTMHYHIYGNKLACDIESRVFEGILETYIGGKTAKNKHLKNIVWALPNKALGNIMRGYLDGDGHYENGNNRFRLGFTYNPYLEMDIRTLAARLGATITLKQCRHKIKSLNKEYDGYRGEWRWDKSNHHNSKSRSEIIEIKEIKRHSELKLWDIEVDSKEHLFSLTSGVITHNCKDNPMPVVKQPRYQDVFEYMFIFSKGKPKTFNPIMIPCKCAGQAYNSTTKNMGGESGRTYKEFNINKEKVKSNVWNCAVAKNNTIHPAVYPEKLVIDHILSWSNENDVVLDPFMGSGTTALACIKTNRKYIGIELNEDYVELSRKRVNDLVNSNI